MMVQPLGSRGGRKRVWSTLMVLATGIATTIPIQLQAVAAHRAAATEGRTLDQKAVKWIQSAYKTKCVNQSDEFTSALSDDDNREVTYICGKAAQVNFKTRAGAHGPFIWKLTFQSAAVRPRHLPTAV